MVLQVKGNGVMVGEKNRSVAEVGVGLQPNLQAALNCIREIPDSRCGPLRINLADRKLVALQANTARSKCGPLFQPCIEVVSLLRAIEPFRIERHEEIAASSLPSGEHNFAVLSEQWIGISSAMVAAGRRRHRA